VKFIVGSDGSCSVQDEPHAKVGLCQQRAGGCVRCLKRGGLNVYGKTSGEGLRSLRFRGTIDARYGGLLESQVRTFR